MSTAATERDLEMLAWLAERDMEAVQHAHRQFLAATEPADVAALGRTYQKVSRCLRTTIALKMKAAESHARAGAYDRVEARKAELVRDLQIERRTIDLQDAMARIGNAAIPDPREREDRLDRFDIDLDDWIHRPDYLAADLDTLVVRACRHMGLPEILAAHWRHLPRPTVFPPDPPADEEITADWGPADVAGPQAADTS